MANRRRTDATPLLLPKVEPDEAVTATIEEPIKKAVDFATAAKTLGGLAVGLFIAGSGSYAWFHNVATKNDVTAAKTELAAQIQAHTTMPHAAIDGGPAINRRIDAFELRLSTTEAKDNANLYWIQHAISELMRERGLRPPPLPMPEVSISPAR